jgi:exodeoxyribonuclease-5
MLLNKTSFFLLLLDNFPYSPTNSQERLLQLLSNFVFAKKEDELFLLKGYAGTGKTTTISTLINNLWQVKLKYALLAPTGRAAKVIGNYANKKAFTIHKKIYYPKKNSSGSIEFSLKPNKHTNTLFIVDEASMIPDSQNNPKFFENSSLLNDLIQYVYSGKNCKLILIGDTAQLPPVKLNLSPALDSSKLSFNYNKNVIEIELDEVMRQHKNSGILTNATELREIINNYYNGIEFKFQSNFPDIIRLIDGYDIENAINECYQNFGIEDTSIIVRSNKRANQYNQQIRSKIRNEDNQIASGDYIMVVKNNYYWLKDSNETDFIANGDICRIEQINGFKEIYGFNFAEVTVKLIDYPKQPAFDTIVLLDTLTQETPSLTYEDSTKLYQEISKDYANLPKYKQFLEVKNNPFFNALQIKFAYAVTCHKAQGGQWKNIIIEQPYLKDGMDLSYYRWLYTAITRAQKKLYLIGFKEELFYD